MRILVCFLILFSAGGASADGSRSASLIAFENRLTAVEWRLRVDDKPDDFCRELYAFSRDGSLTIASGQEILVSQWRVRAVIDSDAIALSVQLQSSNGRPDCQGNITPLDRTENVRYVYDLQNSHLHLCWRQITQSCFATLIPVDTEIKI